MRRAFSLVELSIVLVILGLLVGGILSGQALIRAAQLRAVGTEYSRYTAATYSFRDKYLAIPGDMNNATAFWGKDSTNCAGHTGTASTPGTCNGDGDGILLYASAPNVTGEIWQYWKQLALAGLVEGNYTGLAGSVNGSKAVLGTNSPASKLTSAGWNVYNRIAVTGGASTQLFDGNYDNSLFFGTVQNYTSGAAIKPEEAWNLDTKFDDGNPAQGTVVAWKAGINPGCTTSDTVPSSYAVSTTTTACALIVKIKF